MMKVNKTTVLLAALLAAALITPTIITMNITTTITIHSIFMFMSIMEQEKHQFM